MALNLNLYVWDLSMSFSTLIRSLVFFGHYMFLKDSCTGFKVILFLIYCRWNTFFTIPLIAVIWSFTWVDKPANTRTYQKTNGSLSTSCWHIIRYNGKEPVRIDGREAKCGSVAYLVGRLDNAVFFHAPKGCMHIVAVRLNLAFGDYIYRIS